MSMPVPTPQQPTAIDHIWVTLEGNDRRTHRFLLLTKAFFGEGFSLGLLLTYFETLHLLLYEFSSIKKCLAIEHSNYSDWGKSQF